MRARRKKRKRKIRFDGERDREDVVERKEREN